MSKAIELLHLERPAFTVQRLGNANVSVWAGVCEACGERTKPRPFIGLVLQDMMSHADIHRAQVWDQHVDRLGEVAA